MRKTLLSAMLILSVCAITGCGNKAEKTAEGTVKVEKVEESAVVEAPTPTPEPEVKEAEPTPEATPEPTPEPEPPTWLEEKGLTISPQGDFTYQTMTYDANYQDQREIDIPSTVSIIETTEEVDEGYKRVIASFHDDVSHINRYKEGFLAIHGAFDRYTGIEFDIDSELMYDQGFEKGVIPIDYDGRKYDVSVEFAFISDDVSADYTITVSCPEDYDGAVFYAGYWSQLLASEEANEDKNDDLTELHTMDNFLEGHGSGHPYYYFTYSNQ